MSELMLEKVMLEIYSVLFCSTIFPVESMFVAALAAGEGWHNYHVIIMPK